MIGRRHRRLAAAIAAAAWLLSGGAQAGAQSEEQLAPSVAAGLQRAIADHPVPPDYVDRADLQPWLAEMSPRLPARIADARDRRELLATIHYEARRAGLDPQLVLAVMQVESGFKKFAVSTADARGYMQVMPFWVRQIGKPDQNLFNLRTNLRYGCTILRHYLDRESGDLYRALGRYNGSLGRPEYPSAVVAAMHRWQYAAAPAAARTAATVSAR
ncbi:MAG: transglycosylase SLT domain-containing protein [Betaproteobacteria bacterium]|nr:transglycosylase SLT domain-containing protein [Betaproteobacteria bacterium]